MFQRFWPPLCKVNRENVQLVCYSVIVFFLLLMLNILLHTHIHSSFVKISLTHLHYQTVRARDLKCWTNVHHPLCVTCPVSGVRCLVSGVRCLVSSVRCQVSGVRWHLQSQTVRARELKFWEKVHLPPAVTCHLSCVTCHYFFYFFFYTLVNLVGRWRVCYQLGLPRLVS